MGKSGPADFWNNEVGAAWVRHVEDFDRTLEPFGAAVLQALEPSAGERVLDVGCGVGSTALELARRVAPGQVIGLDISRPMLAAARQRSEELGVSNVRFVEADAQTAELGSEPFDVVFSRFGVMFFNDPVAAFENIRSSMRHGRLGFVAFQSGRTNAFVAVPVMAAAQHLELPPLPDPDGPGPFSLADPDRINSILNSAGFTDVAIEAGPDEAHLYGADDLTSLAARVLERNPMTAKALQAASPSVRSQAIDAAANALAEHRQGDVVSLGAGAWVVTASAG